MNKKNSVILEKWAKELELSERMFTELKTIQTISIRKRPNFGCGTFFISVFFTHNIEMNINNTGPAGGLDGLGYTWFFVNGNASVKKRNQVDLIMNSTVYRQVMRIVYKYHNYCCHKGKLKYVQLDLFNHLE